MRGFVRARGLWRVFIAVDIGDGVRENLGAEMRLLAKSWPRIKWVPIENVHLTLAFLGDVLMDRVPDIARELDGIASGIRAFECVVGGLGYFGRNDAPRVVWAGVSDGRRQVKDLYSPINEMAHALGLQTEAREFTPHLTLARIKSAGEARGLAERLGEERGKVYGTIAVESVKLMRSELRPAGPEYSVLHAAKLMTL